MVAGGRPAHRQAVGATGRRPMQPAAPVSASRSWSNARESGQWSAGGPAEPRRRRREGDVVAVSSSSRLRVQRSIAAAAGALALAALTACASSATPGSGSSSGGGSSSAGSIRLVRVGELVPGHIAERAGNDRRQRRGHGCGGRDRPHRQDLHQLGGDRRPDAGPGLDDHAHLRERQHLGQRRLQHLLRRVDLAGNILSAPTLASTMMACEQALMDQDQWLSSFLASGSDLVLRRLHARADQRHGHRGVQRPARQPDRRTRGHGLEADRPAVEPAAAP